MAALVTAPPVDREDTGGARRRRFDGGLSDAEIRQNWSLVYGIVRSSVRYREEAEELTQEVFARALPHLTKEFDAERARRYMAQTARNLLRDRWRRRQSVIIEPGLPDGPSNAVDPESHAIEQVDRADLVAALGQLSPEQQLILRLRLLEGLSAAEVGDRLGRNTEAVRQLQHRALLRVKAFFLARGAEPEEDS